MNTLRNRETVGNTGNTSALSFLGLRTGKLGVCTYKTVISKRRKFAQLEVPANENFGSIVRAS